MPESKSFGFWQQHWLPFGMNAAAADTSKPVAAVTGLTDAQKALNVALDEQLELVKAGLTAKTDDIALQNMQIKLLHDEAAAKIAVENANQVDAHRTSNAPPLRLKRR